MQFCVMFAVHDGEMWVMVKPRGAWPPTEIEQGFFSGFPRMQSSMFVILCNTIFSCCNFDVYVYIFTYGPTSKYF